jgi:hypothetical protein
VAGIVNGQRNSFSLVVENLGQANVTLKSVQGTFAAVGGCGNANTRVQELSITPKRKRSSGTYVLLPLSLLLGAYGTIDHRVDLWCASGRRCKDHTSVFFLQRVSPVGLTRFLFIDMCSRYKV